MVNATFRGIYEAALWRHVRCGKSRGTHYFPLAGLKYVVMPGNEWDEGRRREEA